MGGGRYEQPDRRSLRLSAAPPGPNAHAHRHSYADGHAYANGYAHGDPYGNSHADRYTEPDTNDNADEHAYRYADAHLYTDGHTDADEHAYINRYADTHAHTHAHADTNAHAILHVPAPPAMPSLRSKGVASERACAEKAQGGVGDTPHFINTPPLAHNHCACL